ncbi:hypothetical protein [Micrococcus endophyticus]|uniref:hypothetical protein n=1 Tax=Micrococcus endophyticus TaxID=455343 RepID=UPI0034CEBBA7
MNLQNMRKPLDLSAEYIIETGKIDNQWHPGLESRARVVLGDALERTIQTPTFLTDLGLRRFFDASEFYEISIASDNYLLDLYRTRANLPEIDNITVEDELLADTLDGLVLLWGDYGRASAIVASLRNYLLLYCNSYKLLTYSASLIADDSPKFAEALYERAQECTSSIANQMVTKLRCCALVLKKEHDTGRALTLLDELQNWIEMQAGDNLVTGADVNTMHAMTLNLKSLARIRLKDQVAAWREISQAKLLVEVNNLSVMGRSEALRYRTQITGNTARLAWLMGKSNVALDLWEENYGKAINEDRYSLSETQFGLAYGLYLIGDYNRSRILAEKSQILIAREASPNRLRLARKVLAAARAKLGDEEGASQVITQMEKDKLGLEIIESNEE